MTTIEDVAKWHEAEAERAKDAAAENVYEGVNVHTVAGGYFARLAERHTDAAKVLREAMGALSRQVDNMAFVLNHVTVPQPWYDKFAAELSADRATLTGERP